MKIKITAAVLLFCILLTGCTQIVKPSEITVQQEPETTICLIPNSYFEFSGSDPEAEVKALNDLGPEYCTSAILTEEGIKAELTEVQRDHLIERNNRFISKFLENYTAANSKYTYETDSEYKKLVFYFDERIPIFVEMRAVFGTATGYCLNQILLNRTDWSVDITIYNCHTKKEVASITVPGEEGSFGAEDWERSYH